MDAILTFHEIGADRSVLSFPPEELAALVEGLREEGAALVPLGDLLAPAPGGRHRVALTFDDGLESVHRHALPILARMSVPAVVYVVSGWVGRTNRWPSQPASAPEMRLMDWGQLREVAAIPGLEVGAHGASHAPLPRLEGQARDEELRSCKEALEQTLQIQVRHFAYPYGLHDAKTAADAGRYYDTAVTTRMRYLRTTEDPLRLPRLDAYYLRGGRGRGGLFGASARRYLGLRALLRRLRHGENG